MWNYIKCKSYAFYTCSFITFRLYVNGDGNGKNTHVSTSFVIMRTGHDHMLELPFGRKVTFRLIHPMDDSFSIRESFQPDRSSLVSRNQKGKWTLQLAATVHSKGRTPYTKCFNWWFYFHWDNCWWWIGYKETKPISVHLSCIS